MPPKKGKISERHLSAIQPARGNHNIKTSQNDSRPHERPSPGQGSPGGSSQSQRTMDSWRRKLLAQQSARLSSPPPDKRLLSREREQRLQLNDSSDEGTSDRQRHQKEQISILQRQLAAAQRECEELKNRNEAEKNKHLQDLQEAQRDNEKSLAEVKKWNSALQCERDEARRENEKSRKQMEEQISILQRQLAAAQRECEELKNRNETERNKPHHELQEAQRDRDKSLTEMKKLQKENAELQARNRDLLQRISSMASERMRFNNNPCVEDLSDPNRHSAVQSRWQAVMNGEYWTLYEAALRKLPSEKATSRFLLRIMELAFTETQSMVGGTGPFMNQLKTLGRNDASLAALVDALEQQHEFRQIVVAEERKLRKKVDSTLPQSALEDFHKKIRSDQRNVGEEMLQKSRKFADEVLGLCYLMALQTPPMALVFDSPEDKEMDTLLYEPDGDRNKRKPWIVSFVLTPPLLQHEGGPILSKGTVELE